MWFSLSFFWSSSFVGSPCFWSQYITFKTKRWSNLRINYNMQVSRNSTRTARLFLLDFLVTSMHVNSIYTCKVFYQRFVWQNPNSLVVSKKQVLTNKQEAVSRSLRIESERGSHGVIYIWIYHKQKRDATGFDWTEENSQDCFSKCGRLDLRTVPLFVLWWMDASLFFSDAGRTIIAFSPDTKQTNRF